LLRLQTTTFYICCERTLQSPSNGKPKTTSDEIEKTDQKYKRYQKQIIQDCVLELPALLSMFPSLQLSLPQVISLTKPLRRRYYSISSAPPLTGDRKFLSITVGVVHQTGASNQSNEYFGVCSHQLSLAHVGESLHARVVPSSFRLPDDPARPLILVCGGTGIAPFRGFLQERARLPRAGIGRCLLYFGCRNEEQVLYRQELEGWASQGVVELRLALSRSKHQPKRYVQDLMAEDRSDLFQLIKTQDDLEKTTGTTNSRVAAVYCCGGARTIGEGVHTALLAILQTAMSQEEAESLLASRLAEGLYQRDVWG
jgi:cytochrome P450/NADPH-cytochrome P450 reductase